MVKVKTGRMVEVKNKDPHHKANKSYIAIHVDDENGNEECLMFTKAELLRARFRTSQNLEDIPAKSWLTDFLDG